MKHSFDEHDGKVTQPLSPPGETPLKVDPELLRYWRTFPAPSNEVLACDLIESLQRELRQAQERIGELKEMLSMACAVAEIGFVTDYGFNYEASIQPRKVIADIRSALNDAAASGPKEVG